MATLSDLKRAWLIQQLGFDTDTDLSEADLEYLLYSGGGSGGGTPLKYAMYESDSVTSSTDSDVSIVIPWVFSSGDNSLISIASDPTYDIVNGCIKFNDPGIYSVSSTVVLRAYKEGEGQTDPLSCYFAYNCYDDEGTLPINPKATSSNYGTISTNYQLVDVSLSINNLIIDTGEWPSTNYLMFEAGYDTPLQSDIEKSVQEQYTFLSIIRLGDSES